MHPRICAFTSEVFYEGRLERQKPSSRVSASKERVTWTAQACGWFLWTTTATRTPRPRRWMPSRRSSPRLLGAGVGRTPTGVRAAVRARRHPDRGALQRTRLRDPRSPAWRACRNGGPFPGAGGAGRDLLDGDVLSGRRPARDGVPLQPESAQRRDVASAVRSRPGGEPSALRAGVPVAQADAVGERAVPIPRTAPANAACRADEPGRFRDDGGTVGGAVIVATSAPETFAGRSGCNSRQSSDDPRPQFPRRRIPSQGRCVVGRLKGLCAATIPRACGGAIVLKRTGQLSRRARSARPPPRCARNRKTVALLNHISSYPSLRRGWLLSNKLLSFLDEHHGGHTGRGGHGHLQQSWLACPAAHSTELCEDARISPSTPSSAASEHLLVNARRTPPSAPLNREIHSAECARPAAFVRWNRLRLSPRPARSPGRPLRRDRRRRCTGRRSAVRSTLCLDGR